jgi:hypothetical protein
MTPDVTVKVVKKKTKKAPKTAVSEAVKKEVKSIVKRELNLNVEKKQIMYGALHALYSFASATSNQDLNVYPLTPYQGYMQIAQGVSDGSRVGNMIVPKYASINFVLYPYPYDATNNPAPRPQEVVFLVLTDKSDPTSVPRPTNNGDFYQANAGTATFSGDLSDITDWYNRDRYEIVHKKIFKLGYSAFGGTGSSASNQFFQNNDYSYNHIYKYNYTKHLPKHIKYNDNNTIPISKGLYAFWYSVPANGSAWSATDRPCLVDFQMHMTYEDA